MSRAVKKTVTFNNSFALSGFDRVLPAGDYTIDTGEEIVARRLRWPPRPHRKD